jgi:5,10-methylene-tetrahydrofolate dehydrogenase/methenyl tetrahydrofolate cyclohydrolase
MGRKSRTKGKAGELEIMHAGRAAGLDVEKVSRAGYVGHDLEASLLGAKRRIEVKRRSTGLKQVYSWLANADILVARVDRKEAIVVLPLSLALQIAARAENNEPV